jgi:hypothetical protein
LDEVRVTAHKVNNRVPHARAAFNVPSHFQLPVPPKMKLPIRWVIGSAGARIGFSTGKIHQAMSVGIAENASGGAGHH